MPPGKVLSSDKRQFIIAQRRMGGMMQPIGLQPLGFDFVEQALRSSPDVEVVDSIGKVVGHGDRKIQLRSDFAREL